MNQTFPSTETVSRTIEALAQNGIEALFLPDGAAAKAKVIELLPEGAEVMTMTSATLDALGLSEEINKSGRYRSIRDRLVAMNRETEGHEMRRLGAAPEWVIGSAHAVTEDGHVLIASASGSQLPAYAYGAGHVIWVAGTQKIVKNFDEAMRRIYDYVLPLESERAKKAYGVAGSAVNKLLVVNREFQKGRITLILAGEALGF